MKKPKVSIVFSNLNYLSLLIFPVFKLIYAADIFYCEIDKHFGNSSKLISYLEAKGIKWIKKEYHEFSEYEAGYSVAGYFVDVLFKILDNMYMTKEIEKYLGITNGKKKKMNVAWKYNIFQLIEPFLHQYAAAAYLIKNNKCDKVFLITYSSLANLLNGSIREKKGAIREFYIPGIELILTFLRIFKKFFLTKIINTGSQKKNSIQSKNDTKEKQVDISKFKIAFFPHEGVFYGKLFIKDHFYDENIKSPLHKTKILHISLNEKNKSFMADSYEYYNKNNIRYIDAQDFECGKKIIMKSLFKLLFQKPVKTINELCRLGSGIYFLLILTFFKIETFTYFISQLKNVKIVLAGYDYLFPIELSIACALRGIKTCASQERFIQAFYPQTMNYCFDYYFTAGKVVADRGLKRCQIENCIPVGLVRVDKLFKYSQMPDRKYDEIKKSKKLILALDYHLPEDDLEDISRSVAKISQIRKFYGDLIKLAKYFQDIHIVIKGKFAGNYKSQYILDIVKEISNIRNINIELDFDHYNSYLIAEKADLTIACHTSLADELLALGRKVIFYESTDYMKANFDYDNLPIVVSNYEELKFHIQNFLSGIYLDENRINKLKDFYSNCDHGQVQKQIKCVLEQIIYQENKQLQQDCTLA